MSRNITLVSCKSSPAISVLIPCYEADATVHMAVASALDQTFVDLEVILASDDDRDYLAILDVRDDRLHQVSTGEIGAGDGPARNAALAVANGRYVANLDADDTMRPERLARMLPVAERYGAVADNTTVWIDGRFAKTAFPPGTGDFQMTIDSILKPRVPLCTLVRRDLAAGGWHHFPFCSDVVFNLEVLSRCPSFRALRWSGYDYMKRDGSVTQSPDTPERAARGYTEILAAIDEGRLDLTEEIAAAARDEFSENIKTNHRFRSALANGRCRTLEDFLATEEAS